MSRRFVVGMSIVCALGTGACESPDEAGAGESTTVTTTLDELTIQGHRGARGLRPENTLPAFERALDLKVDTLELDLHLSRDDRLVVWHDPFVRETKCRIPDGAPDHLAVTTEAERAPAARVRTLSADALAAYDCSRNPEPDEFPDQSSAPTELAGGDYGIVTLSRLFDFVEAYGESDEKTEAQRSNAETVRFNVELKRHPGHPEFIDDGYDGSGPALMERRLVDLVRERGLTDRVTVQSFDPRAILAVHSIAPDLRLAALESSRTVSFKKLADAGVDIWSPDAKLVDEQTLRRARDVGLAVLPWTVNEPAEMRRLADLGVDGLITDRPDLFFRAVRRE